MVEVAQDSPVSFCVKPHERPSDLCAPFARVTHTTHVANAIEALRRGQLRPNLVYDESHLNDDRITVVWLSPNRWYYGYRYGNIQFEFDWASLVASKRAYWVEVAKYNTPAVRILLTDQDHSSHHDLLPYDPTRPDGSWWFDADSNTHHFNGSYCLELMLEGHLSDRDVVDLSFVNHHVAMCSEHRFNPTQCPEIGMQAQKGGAIFLAGVVAHEITSQCLSHLTATRAGDPLSKLAWVWDRIKRALARYGESSGGWVRSDAEEAATFARSALFLLYERQVERIAHLAKVFATTEHLIDSVARMIETHFSLPVGTSLSRDL